MYIRTYDQNSYLLVTKNSFPKDFFLTKLSTEKKNKEIQHYNFSIITLEAHKATAAAVVAVAGCGGRCAGQY